MAIRDITKAAISMAQAPAASSGPEVLPAIRKLGLEKNVAEIEALGYTVILPQQMNSNALAERLLERICEISASERGVVPDFERGTTHDNAVDPVERQTFLLAKGRVFEEALMNPVVQTLVRYLLGKDAVLSSCLGRIKGRGALPLMLHTDQSFHPAPQPLVCNATYVLTDYSRENGALCFVPGSHKLQRHPVASENFDLGGKDRAAAESAIAGGRPLEVNDPPNLTIVEAPAGSLVVWPGNTWHGAVARTAPGLRVNLLLYFCNKWLRPQEAYREYLPDEVLERNDAEFARMIGSEIFYGWGPEGTNFNAAEAFLNSRSKLN